LRSTGKYSLAPEIIRVASIYGVILRRGANFRGNNRYSKLVYEYRTLRNVHPLRQLVGQLLEHVPPLCDPLDGEHKHVAATAGLLPLMPQLC
jgi:hypothetical protein